MGKSYITFSRSPYFAEEFNSAIYDGPIRIYFTKSHEALAMSFYLQLMSRESEKVQELKRQSKDHNDCVFILFYPDDASFQKCFKMAAMDQDQAVSFFKEHKIIGLRNISEDMDFGQAIENVICDVQVGLSPAPQFFAADL